MKLEQSVCGLKEPVVFWLWSAAAGRPKAKHLAGLEGIEDISFTTKDQRTLRGYRLRASVNGSASTSRPSGYLLILQGNAMLADQIVGQFTRYADEGYDVYVYDYRGYGRSGGKRRLKAMVSDTNEIILDLNSKYEKRLVYAMSFGGILFLNALQPNTDVDRAVVDSSPSRLSTYGCPETYDPIGHVPMDSRHIMFIAGLNDTVVTPVMSRDMVGVARERDAEVVIDPQFAHPFMDSSPAIHQRRMQLIRQFLFR